MGENDTIKNKGYSYKTEQNRLNYIFAQDSASVNAKLDKYDSDCAMYHNLSAYNFMKDMIYTDEDNWYNKKEDLVSLWLEKGKKSALINNAPDPKLRRKLRTWDAFISSEGIDGLRAEKNTNCKKENGELTDMYDNNTFRETYPDADYIQYLVKNIGTDKGRSNMFKNFMHYYTKSIIPLAPVALTSQHVFNESEPSWFNRVATSSYPDNDYYKNKVDTKIEKLQFNIPYKLHGFFGIDELVKDSDKYYQEFQENLSKNYGLSINYLNTLDGVSITQSESDNGGWDVSIKKGLPGDLDAKILSCIPSAMLRGSHNLLHINGIGFDESGQETVLCKGKDHVNDNIILVRELKNRISKLRNNMEMIDNTDMTTLSQVRTLLANVPIDELLYDEDGEKFSDTKAKYDFYTEKAKTLLKNSIGDVSNKYFIQGYDEDNLYHLIDNTNSQDVEDLVANADIEVSGGTTGSDCGILYTLSVGKDNEKKLYRIYAPSLSPLTEYMQRDPNKAVYAAIENSQMYGYPLPTLNGNISFNDNFCTVTDDSNKPYRISIEEGQALMLATYMDVEMERIITNAKASDNALNLKRLNDDLSDNKITQLVLENFLSTYYPELYNAYATDNIIGVDKSKISRIDFLNGTYNLNNVNTRTDAASRYVRQLINRLKDKKQMLNIAEPLQ